ncbi:uncharacterized protein ColSpa_02883 [Colletotrichum spaethianum]|uniref:Uncharacterized protein n=1 Tax=Colletotrichum spaethianum TaxID=700344 RepID=A0AA37LEE5_9PEZI|nr:uncharacterized protein ColSpa_02883 [Colletotrichum spaethianum]GKT42702.1 hypothetical protein ColSpa_02883 [Colletotrichum spaethianum]
MGRLFKPLLFAALSAAVMATQDYEPLPDYMVLREYSITEQGQMVPVACPTCARCLTAGHGCFRCCVQDSCWCTCDGGGKCYAEVAA